MIILDKLNEELKKADKLIEKAEFILQHEINKNPYVKLKTYRFYTRFETALKVKKILHTLIDLHEIEKVPPYLNKVHTASCVRTLLAVNTFPVYRYAKQERKDLYRAELDSTELVQLAKKELMNILALDKPQKKTDN